jgi:hypothetical protein
MGNEVMRFEWKGYYWIVISNRIVKILGRVVSLGDNAMGITFYPFLFVREDTRYHEELIRHETIHIRQQLELLIVGAWLLYIIEYIYARYIKKLDARQAYYYTALEQEAHRNAANVHYLQERKPYAVLRYIRDKKWLGRTADSVLIEKDYM